MDDAIGWGADVTRDDNLGEIVERYPTVRRMFPLLLGAAVFRSWKSDDPLLAAPNLPRVRASRPNALLSKKESLVSIDKVCRLF